MHQKSHLFLMTHQDVSCVLKQLMRVIILHAHIAKPHLMISKDSMKWKRLTFQMFAFIAGHRWSQASIGLEATAFLNASLALLRDGCVPMRLNIRKNVDISGIWKDH